MKLRNSTKENILLLFTGTGIAQIIPAIASLVLARLYTKTDYGDLSVFMSITGVIGAVAALRYELAIILPRKKEDARNLLALCVLSSFAMGLLSLIVVALCFPLFESKLDISNNHLLYLVPVMVICMGIYNSFENWFNREEAYSKMSLTKIVLSVASAGIRVLFGFAGIALGLIYGTALSYIIAATLFFCFFVKKEGFVSYKLVSFTKMKELFCEYKDFFKYSTTSALFNTMSHIGLPLLISYFYSIELAGIYFFANTLIRQPIQLLSGSVAQVYKKRANLLYLEGSNQLLSFTVKMQKGIFLFVFPILILFSIWGGDIFSFLFGHEWEASGDIIKYFAIFILFNANFSPVSSILDILRKQKISLFFNLSMVFSQVVLLLLFSGNLSFNHMILLLSISGAIHFLYIDIYLKNCTRKLHHHEKDN